MRPTTVTFAPILTVVRPEQPRNAWLPMLVTVSGIATLSSAEQLRNATLPIVLTPLPQFIVFSDVQL